MNYSFTLFTFVITIFFFQFQDSSFFVNFKIPQYFYETLSVGHINFSRPRHYCQSVGQMDRMRLINEQNAMSVTKQANIFFLMNKQANIWFYLFVSILSRYVSNLLNSRNKTFFLNGHLQFLRLFLLFFLSHSTSNHDKCNSLALTLL